MQRVGETAYLLSFGSAAGAVCALRKLERAPPRGLRDLVPGALSLLVETEDGFAGEGALRDVELACARADDGVGPGGARHEFEVGYDGVDLAEVAARAGLSIAEAVRLHASVEYLVAFVGFRPGFAYLHGLPAALHTPRLGTPRPRVPAGSLAIGGEWTGIYPAASPGGWRLIGSSDLALFDPGREEPCLLAPGDRVRFVPR